MEMNFEYRGIGNTIRILLTAVAAVLIPAPVSAGSHEDREDQAITACSETLTANYRANEFSYYRVRRLQRNQYYARTTARLANGETIRVRCLVRHGSVVKTEVYLPVNRASVNSRSRWTAAEPYRVAPEPDADVPAETTPEQEPEKSEAPLEIDPAFKTPGTGTGFKTPGTETGFKTPGTETGSLFKPAK